MTFHFLQILKPPKGREFYCITYFQSNFKAKYNGFSITFYVFLPSLQLYKNIHAILRTNLLFRPMTQEKYQISDYLGMSFNGHIVYHRVLYFSLYVKSIITIIISIYYTRVCKTLTCSFSSEIAEVIFCRLQLEMGY